MLKRRDNQLLDASAMTPLDTHLNRWRLGMLKRRKKLNKKQPIAW